MASKHLPSEGVDWGGFLRVSCTFSGGVGGPLGNGLWYRLCHAFFLDKRSTLPDLVEVT